MDDGETIRVIPVPDDPIPSLMGTGAEDNRTPVSGTKKGSGP